MKQFMIELGVGNLIKCLGEVKKDGINVLPIVKKALLKVSNSTN